MIVYEKSHDGEKAFQEIDLKSIPEHLHQIDDRILIYESHEKALVHLESIFRDTVSRSLIVVGQTKCGKKTLLRLAEMRTEVKTIFINSLLYPDDVNCLQYILEEAGIGQEKTFPETLEKLKSNRNSRSERFVVVLTDFERLFRDKQKLLYNLFDLIKANVNMALIGLTISYDVTEKMEKRVRSRINADFYELEDLYTNAKEFVQFARYLFGHVKLKKDVEKDLERLYLRGQTRILDIKDYFFTKCAVKCDDSRLKNLEDEIISKE